MTDHIVLGVDIGGTGIKGGLIDIKKGEMISERHRIPTPKPATPEAVADVFKELVDHFSWKGLIGVGFPAIIRKGKACSASNIDNDWVGTDIKEVLSNISDCEVHVLNDADAAGLASMRFGTGKGRDGVVIMLTIGTGIGSATFLDGELIPNSELGHLYLKDQKEVAEKKLSKAMKKEQKLTWFEWAIRFNQYLAYLNRLFSPDLVILGGGGSKNFDKFKIFLDAEFEVQPATLLNQAGAIGAACYAVEQSLKNA